MTAFYKLSEIKIKIHAIVLIISFLTFSATANQFYISTNGNDTNPGTKEKPFATLERAKIAVQNSVLNGKENFTIWIADGIYQIEKPIVFEADFFSKNQKLSIKAEKGANPLISGGINLKNWKKNKDEVWETQLPGKQNWKPREMYVDGKRAVRARFPNLDYLRVKKVGKDRRTNFFFENGDFPIPENSTDTELVLLHDWSISRIAVKKIDAKKNQLFAVDSIGAKNPAFFNLDHWEKNPRYFLENAFEFLDGDFEWFLDAKKGKVFLKLPKNQNPNSLQITVPLATSLIQIKGIEDKTVKNISFEGIAFRHCTWEIPELGYCGVQACNFDARPSTVGWREVPAAVKLEWAENCTFNNCSFENLGTSGLWISTACKFCQITNSTFFDISGNGIMVGEGRDRFIEGEVWWKKAPEQVAIGNIIENCSVEESGAQFYGAVGIWCGFTADTKIKNNTISNLPYSGISIGWEWSPIPTPCRENIIDGNHIHHILKILSDGGGIYMLGLQPGSKLINNHIHDVKVNAGRAESNGMFLDEGTTDVVVSNNLIYRIAKSPLRFHKATTNLVKDNYLFCGGQNPPIRYNRTNEEDIRKKNNSVFYESDDNYKEELNQVIKLWKQ